MLIDSWSDNRGFNEAVVVVVSECGSMIANVA